MRQGSKSLVWSVATALVLLAAIPCVAPRHADAAGKSNAAASVTKAGPQRQFTGYVTAMDKSTITVEKRGKKPQSRTFSRHAELQTDGDLAKDARVTVYYRDENGQSVAQRVIVKAAPATPKSDR